jgi:hypothetical protein
VKRDLSKEVVATKLWVPDQQVFDDEVRRRRCKPAELLREIGHEWAKKMRLSGNASDDVEKTIRATHEKIVADQLAPVKDALSLLLGQVRSLTESNAQSATAPEAGSQSIPQSEFQLNHSEQPQMVEQILRLFEEVSAARNDIQKVTETITQASSQQGEQLSMNEVLLTRLTALAKAHFMLSGQEFSSVWATLDFIQRYIAEPLLKSLGKDDPYEASITHRDDARKEGLEMVGTMCQTFQFPGSLEMPLINPPGETIGTITS